MTRSWRYIAAALIGAGLLAIPFLRVERNTFRIAYVDADRGISRIETINLDGTEVTTVTRRKYAWSPLWSPDGSKIAYQGPPDGFNLHVVNADGSSDIDLSGSSPDGVGGGIYDYAWSPDVSRLAFSFGIDQGELEYDIESSIFVVSVDGSDLIRLTDSKHDNRYVSWSPLGDRIVFMSNSDGSSDIYTIAPDGTDRRQLTHSNHHVVNESPVWSPDGETIFYSRGPSQIRPHRSIWSMQADGTQKTKVWRLRGDSAVWVLSPDGEQFVMTQEDLQTGRYQLSVVDSDGGSFKQISSVDGDVYSPSWSPDGRQIAYVARRPVGGWTVYVRNADGTGARRLTSGRGLGSPQWQPFRS